MIERDVIDDGVDDIPSYKIEVYQVLINYQLANQTVIYTTEMSRQTTIGKRFIFFFNFLTLNEKLLFNLFNMYKFHKISH